MEAKCDGCSEFYSPVDLRVMQNSTFWCEECWKSGKIPKGVPPLLVNYPLSFKQLLALCNYIDGERDWDVLEIISDLEESLKFELLKILRRVLKKDASEISESDSESLG